MFELRSWLSRTIVAMILLQSLTVSSASAVTFVPAGTTIQVQENSYLFTQAEGQDIAIAYRAKEVEASENSKALIAVTAKISDMDTQLTEIIEAQKLVPEMIKQEVKAAHKQGYKKGFLDGIITMVIVGGVVYLAR